MLYDICLWLTNKSLKRVLFVVYGIVVIILIRRLSGGRGVYYLFCSLWIEKVLLFNPGRASRVKRTYSSWLGHWIAIDNIFNIKNAFKILNKWFTSFKNTGHSYVVSYVGKFPYTGFISLLLPGNRDVARDVRGEGADCSHYGKASLSAFSIKLCNPWNKIGFIVLNSLYVFFLSNAKFLETFFLSEYKSSTHGEFKLCVLLWNGLLCYISTFWRVKWKTFSILKSCTLRKVVLKTFQEASEIHIGSKFPHHWAISSRQIKFHFQIHWPAY